MICAPFTVHSIHVPAFTATIPNLYTYFIRYAHCFCLRYIRKHTQIPKYILKAKRTNLWTITRFESQNALRWTRQPNVYFIFFFLLFFVFRFSSFSPFVYTLRWFTSATLKTNRSSLGTICSISHRFSHLVNAIFYFYDYYDFDVINMCFVFAFSLLSFVRS